MITFAKMGDGFVKAIMPQGGHDKDGNFHWDAIYFHADDEREYRDKLSVYNNSRQKAWRLTKTSFRWRRLTKANCPDFSVHDCVGGTHPLSR